MKIYYIDKEERDLVLKEKLQEKGIENIEVKNSYNFRCTKNDIVILNDYLRNNDENDILKKYNNLIILTSNVDEETVEELVNNYKIKDIIYSKCNDDYIAERIEKLII